MPKTTKIQHNPLLALRGITKSFPGIVANKNIDLDIFPSEIHALLGENGAGKSTLMKILYGFYRADSGTISLNGTPVQINSPHDARSFQIGMVFQDFNLIPVFTVAENIALFLHDLNAVLNIKAINKRIEVMSTRYDLQVNPQARVSQLSIGEQQKVEILKLLLSDSRILILDEPTRVLAPHEVEALFSILENLRKDGYAIILITHKLKEVLKCSNRITVLCGGKVAGSILRSAATEDILVEMMFGKDLKELNPGRKSAVARDATPLLDLRNIHTQGVGLAASLKDISLQVFPGEIVGVAGVSGNGQKELADVVLGMEHCQKGRNFLFDKDCTNISTTRIRRKSLGYIPENPLAMAIIPFMSVIENSALTKTGLYARFGGLLMDWKRVKSDIAISMKKLGFTFQMYVPARSLSGGNLQRMVIAREMSHDPQLIIASYLTRGLDVQSTIAARQALVQAREHGAGILLISEDLEELFTLSDRLFVLFNGRIAGEFKPSTTNFNEVGHIMTGSKVEHGKNR